jgi:hypothetical protein
VSARIRVAVALATMTVAGLTAGAALAATGSTTRPPPPPPAPPGYAASLTNLYATLYQTVLTLDAKTGQSLSKQLMVPSQFSKRVSELSPAALARLHEATEKQRNWDQIAPASKRLLAVAQSTPTIVRARALRSRAAVPRGRSRVWTPLATARPQAIAANTASVSSFPPDEPLGNFPAPPPTFQPSSPVDPVNPITCASNGNPYPYYVASDTAIVIGDTVSAAADAAYAIIPGLAPFFIEESYVDPLKIVAAVLVGAADLAVAGLENAQKSAEDCDLVNQTSYSDNADNSTVNGFALEQQNEQTIGAIKSSVNTIHDQVHTVRESLSDELTVEIQQALALPATAPADVYYELPASAGGNLDSAPVGVQAVVTNAYNAAKQAGLPVNATATSNLTAANNALAAHNYKAAWKNYQAAYQALG